MTHLLRTVFLTGFLLFAGTTAADTESEIKAVLDYLAEMWNEGDLNAVRGYYHRDFVLVTSEGILSMGQRLDDLEAIMEPGKDHGELGFSEIQVKPLGKERAMAYGRSSLKFEDKTEFGTYFSTIYVKTPFGWKAILGHE
jgi:ketosteroid isomerase-like protein